MNSQRTSATQETLHRIYSEFMEMPGLRLTCEQAQRLWGLDEAACRQLLQRLVDAKFLSCGTKGMYARRTGGPTELPSLESFGEVKGRREHDAQPGPATPGETTSGVPTMESEDITIAAHSDVPVLIASDRAQDRERCARSIHEQSRRASRPFVRFSGAQSAAEGDVCRLMRDRFHRAQGGTLFIDDVARLDPGGQQQLLQLLEQWMASPRGRDVRILAGASGLLESRRTAGAFNESLFYRLNEIRLDLADRQRAGAPGQRLLAGARPA